MAANPRWPLPLPTNTQATASKSTLPGQNRALHSTPTPLKRLLKLAWICRMGIDWQLLHEIDQLIILGADAQVELPGGVQPTIERWITDEPSARGIKGIERMRLIRDDIDDRVRDLLSQLVAQ